MNQGKLREVFVGRFLRSLYGNALWMDDGNLIFGILIDRAKFQFVATYYYG